MLLMIYSTFLYTKGVILVPLTLSCHWATCHSFSQWHVQQPHGSQNGQNHNPLSHFHHKPPWKREIWKCNQQSKHHAIQYIEHAHTTVIKFFTIFRNTRQCLDSDRAWHTKHMQTNGMSPYVPCRKGCSQRQRMYHRGPYYQWTCPGS